MEKGKTCQIQTEPKVFMCNTEHILNYLNPVAWATLSSLYTTSSHCFSDLLFSVEVVINIHFNRIFSSFEDQ